MVGLPGEMAAYPERISSADNERERANQEKVKYGQDETTLPFSNPPGHALPAGPQLSEESPHRSEKRVNKRGDG